MPTKSKRKSTWAGPRLREKPTAPASAGLSAAVVKKLTLTDEDKARIAALANEIAGGNADAIKLCRSVYAVAGEAGMRLLLDAGWTGARLVDDYTVFYAGDVSKLLAAARKSVEKRAVKAASGILFDQPTTVPATTTTESEATAVEASPEAKRLMDECGAIRVAWTWFRTGRKIDKDSKSRMATAAGTTDTGFSASKRLMDSKHPTIKEANGLRGRISSFVRGLTLPVTKLGEESITSKKEGGTYLLRKQDMAAFEQRMTAFQSELGTMEARVNGDLESIKDADRLRLGSLFREADYPASVQLRVGYYAVNLDPPQYLAKFAPKMFEAERCKAERWWEGVYANAATEFMEEFRAVIGSWVEALGPVVTLAPPDGHDLRRLYGAEVRTRTTHADEPESVPEGQFVLTVRYKDQDHLKRSVDEVLPPMTEAEYKALNPREQVDKARTFKNSTVENLVEVVQKFRRLGDTVSASKDFRQLVEEVEKQIGKAGENPEQIAKELRESKTFRGGTHELMRKLGDHLDAEIKVFSARKRRRVDTKLLAGTEHSNDT